MGPVQEVGAAKCGALVIVDGIWALPFAALAQRSAGPATATTPEVIGAPRHAAAASPTRGVPITPTDSAALRRRRPRLLVGGAVLGYGIIYTGLTTVWYTSERIPLHWFNDLSEWQQLDNYGHFWGAFQVSRGAVDMLR